MNKDDSSQTIELSLQKKNFFEIYVIIKETSTIVRQFMNKILPIAN